MKRSNLKQANQRPFFLQVLYHNCHFHCDCNINDIHHDINDKLSKRTRGRVSKKSMNSCQKKILILPYELGS